MSDELRATARRILAGEPFDVRIAKEIVRQWDAEHPADDDEPVDIGTCYCDDNIRVEIRVIGPGQASLAFQSRGTEWKWCAVRNWTYPALPTRGDVRRLLAALGLEVSK